MVRIGVTGHMNISAATFPLVRDVIARYLSGVDDLVGVSCIARGADSVFAEAVLDAGGALEVVLPSRTYRERKVKPDHAPLFDELVRRATAVRVMDFEEANADAYEVANETVLSLSDRLIAVWDGQDGQRSGTGSVVAAARAKKIPVDVVWPDGASRD